jgi:hypothetical protein
MTLNNLTQNRHNKIQISRFDNSRKQIANRRSQRRLRHANIHEDMLNRNVINLQNLPLQNTNNSSIDMFFNGTPFF